MLNPESNACFLTYEILLETGESLYVSDLVCPGSEINSQTLTRGLAAGEYTATIKVRAFDMTSMVEMNGANLKTKIIAVAENA